MSPDLLVATRYQPIACLTEAAADPRSPASVLELREQCAPQRLCRILKRLSNDPEAVSELARSSYRHPNGFIKLILAKHSNGSRVRMHVWDSASEASDIHDHFWDFSSMVVTGQLRSERFRRSARGVIFEELDLLWRPQDAFALRQSGKQPLACISETVASAGQTHALDASDLHRVSVWRHGLTATVVLQGRDIRPDNHVFRTPGNVPLRAFRPRRLMSDEVRKVLNGVIRSIRA